MCIMKRYGVLIAGMVMLICASDGLMGGGG